MTTVNVVQVAGEISARAEEADRAGRLPAEDVADLIESGYLALPVPREYGGAEESFQEIVRAHLELSKGSASTALVAAMTLHLFGHGREARPYAENCFAEMSRRLLDGALFNVVASEPAMGSPSRGHFYATTATRDENGSWVINGRKTWVTGGRHLTDLVVKLSLDDGMGVIWLPNDGRDGLRWAETWGDALSLRASDSHDLHFENVLVAGDALIQRGEGNQEQPNGWFPMLVGATYLGSALAARDAAIQYALERVPTALGKPIATLPKIQRQIGEIDIVLQAARALLLEVSGEWDAHPTERAALFPRVVAAKQFAVESAMTVTDLALKIAGGQSLTPSLPLERYFRDVRAGSMQPPAGDTALEIIGRGAIQRHGGA